MYFAAAILSVDPVLNSTTAIVTDGRYSGAMRGPCVGHVTPEALDGGPIALVEENDLIELNIPERRLAIVGIDGRGRPEAEVTEILAQRRGRWSPRPPRHSRGILALYERLASDAGARRHRGGAGQGQGLASGQPTVQLGQRGHHAARRLLLGRSDRHCETLRRRRGGARSYRAASAVAGQRRRSGRGALVAFTVGLGSPRLALSCPGSDRSAPGTPARRESGRSRNRWQRANGVAPGTGPSGRARAGGGRSRPTSAL
jgi:Dehydratase family